MSNKPDMVSHPPHYQSETGLEVIDVIKAFTSDLNGIEATDTGNIIKYICRWKHKNGLEDLKKAKWYLEHLINIIEDEKTAKEMAMQVVIGEGLISTTTNTKLDPCEYEGKPMHPYGDRSCMAVPGFALCKGHVNCAKYEPCKTLKRCKYAEVEYNTVLCYGTREKDPCPGYDKCDRYKPIDD